MKRRSKNKYIKTKNYILFLFAVFGIMILFINDFGIVKLISLKKEKYTLENKLELLNQQQNNLRKTIHKLKYDQDYIEKIARERYMMVLPGEKVFRIAHEKQLHP